MYLMLSSIEVDKKKTTKKKTLHVCDFWSAVGDMERPHETDHICVHVGNADVCRMALLCKD